MATTSEYRSTGNNRLIELTMAKLVFRLKDVPIEEADAIRALLQENHIAFYETDAGNWGVSLAGIWVQDNAEALTARTLIDDFQQSHHMTSRIEEVPGFLETVRQQPLKFLLSVIIIAVILYYSIKPFLVLGR